MVDYMATHPGFWDIRGQCHISREHKDHRVHPDSPVPDDQVTGQTLCMKDIASHAYFDQTMDIPVVYPPVFLLKK